MADLNTIRLDPNGDDPTIEVKFGQANWGTYVVYLYDSNGKNPTKVSEGINTDNIPDISRTGRASELDKKILYWQLRTAKFEAGPGGDYYMAVIVRQGANILKQYEYQGTFSSAVQDVVDYVRFVV